MKRNFLSLFLILAISSSSLADETIQQPAPQKTTGKAAYYGSRDATVLSMMGWGVAIVVGIGAVCALIPNNDSSAQSH